MSASFDRMLELAGIPVFSGRLLREQTEDEEEDEDAGEEEDSEDSGDDEEEAEPDDESPAEDEEQEAPEVDKDFEEELRRRRDLLNKVTPAETRGIQHSIDDALETLFADIEAKALRSGALQQESRSRYSLKHYLLNEEAQEETPVLDVAEFASEVARFVNNYDTLLDMEALIINGALKHIIEHYDEDTAQEMLDILKTQYEIDIFEKEEAPQQPIAVGAMPGGSAA